MPRVEFFFDCSSPWTYLAFHRIEDLCREVFLSNFEIYQTLWALNVLGVVEERD